jgi:hypothetical protein
LDERGSISIFLVCKVGVALAVLSLMGVALASYSSAQRTVEREELEMVADSIIGAIRTADSLPGEMVLERRLPNIEQQFEVEVIGSYSNFQSVRVRMIAKESIEKTSMLMHRLNSGAFEMRCSAPTMLRLQKSDGITFELI